MKKIISLLLILILLLPSSSMICAAADEDPNVVYVRVSDLGLTHYGAGWHPSSLKDDLGHATNITSKAGETCEWRPTLAKGYYEVYVWKVFHENSATAVNFDIFSADGGDSVTLNYAEGEPGWVKLGTYLFDEGTNGYVVAGGTGGYMRSGPMKFVRTVEPGTEDTTSTFSDTYNSPYKEAIEFLAKLGISDVFEGEFRPANNITYNEFMTYVSHCMGEDHAIKTSDAESITYNEAVREIIYMLGYEIMAEKDGGYPGGYLAVASRLNILKKTNQTGETPITREVAAQLIYNATSVDILQTVGFGAYLEFEAVEGVTVLSEYMDIYKIEGQVTANYYTSFTGDSGLDKGKVKIGNTIYDEGNSRAGEFIGQRVTVYAKGEDKTDEEKTILYIETKNLEKEILKVSSEDILSGTTTKKFCYSQNGKRREINIDLNPIVIYNGRAKIDYSVLNFNPSYGDVELIDSDGNGKYDVIISNNYKSLVVDSVDYYTKKVYFKDESAPEWNSINLDEEETNILVKFTYADETEATIEEIMPWDILSVAYDENGGNNGVLLVIKGAKKLKNQKIDAISEDGADIGGRTYKFAHGLLGNPEKNQPYLNEEAIFHLDFMGNIAAIDYSGDSIMKYGYLFNLDSEGVFKTQKQLKIFTQDSKWEIFSAAKNVKFNGTHIKDKDINSSNSATSLLYDSGEIKPQMISYAVNDENEIYILNVAQGPLNDNEMNRLVIDETIENSDGIPLHGTPASGFVMASRWYIGNETKIFLVPADKTKEDDYRVIDINNLYDNLSFSKVNVYDANEERVVGAIQTEADNFAYLKGGSMPAIITKVTMGLRDDGDYVPNLHVLANGQSVVLKATNNVTEAIFADSVLSDAAKDNASVNGSLPEKLPLSKLEVGDVIQYAANSEGEIDAIRVLYRVNSPLKFEHNAKKMGAFKLDTGYSSTLYYAVCDIQRATSSYVVTEVADKNNGDTLTGTNGMYTRIHCHNAKTIVLRHNLETDEIEPITVNDIVQGDEVFLLTLSGVNKLIIVRK